MTMRMIPLTKEAIEHEIYTAEMDWEVEADWLEGSRCENPHEAIAMAWERAQKKIAALRMLQDIAD